MHYYVGGRIILKEELALKFKILCGDKDYKLTVSDIKLLKNTLKTDCSYRTRKTINEILYREDVSFDSKILKEFLKVDLDEDNYINKFVFYSDVKNMIKRTGYNLQEKMELKILEDIDVSYYSLIGYVKINSIPVEEKIAFIEKWASLGFDVNSLDIKDMDMLKLFFEKAQKVPLEVAQKMTLCEDKDVIYNLYEHFLEYGITPKKTAVIAKTLSMEKENMVINNYIYNHNRVFSYIPYSKIETMERGSSLYDAYYRLENDCVNYDRKSLLKAFDDLTDNRIPLCRGTLFEALKKYDKSNKTLSKKDNKGSC